jgi:hypothetical protein
VSGSSLEFERLKGRSLFVGTPMYAGQCHSQYALGIAQLSSLCTQLGVHLRFFFACHEPLVTKARNSTVDRFLASGDGNLIFIDADIGFDPQDVLALLALQELGEHGDHFDVIAAPYPIKRMEWGNVLVAAKAGLADGNPAALAGYATRVAIDPAQSDAFSIGAPVEVSQAATGFMMIRRATFDRLAAEGTVRSYVPERRGIDEQAAEAVVAFFDTYIDDSAHHIERDLRGFLDARPDADAAAIRAFLGRSGVEAGHSGTYVSEDYAFCHAVRAAGMKVWLCPWMELSHTGGHTFTSRLADLARIGAA